MWYCSGGGGAILWGGSGFVARWLANSMSRLYHVITHNEHIDAVRFLVALRRGKTFGLRPRAVDYGYLDNTDDYNDN